MSKVSEKMNKTKVLRNKWLELSEDEKNILGRPSFACGSASHRMREMGFEVPKKAEKEQALVIFIALEFYKKYGSNWAKEFNEFLRKE